MVGGASRSFGSVPAEYTRLVVPHDCLYVPNRPIFDFCDSLARGISTTSSTSVVQILGATCQGRLLRRRE